MNIDTWYAGALTDIMTCGPKEVNQRTNMRVRSLPGLTYQTYPTAHGFPLMTLRAIPVKNFIAEQCWFLSGAKHVKTLEKWTKLWNSFTNEDGTIPTAYGYRWRHHFGFDQLHNALERLRKDPSTRHGVVMMWDPKDMVTPSKNVPCPYTFTLMIIGNMLHMHVIVRSNDMILGFPTDVAGFVFLQLILAQYLGIEPGRYTHSISNAHIYSNHFDAAIEMIERNKLHHNLKKIPIDIPPNAYERAQQMDEEFITLAIQNFSREYNPMEPIKGLTISL